MTQAELQQASNQQVDLQTKQSSSVLSKTTSNQNFQDKLKQVLASGVGGIGGAVGMVGGTIPGAAVLSNAMNQAASNLAEGDLRTDGNPFQAQRGLPAGVGNASPGMPGSILPKGGSAGNLTQSVELMQDKMMSNNLYMLGVQREFQQMSEYFTMMSNLLRTKHDTEKNAISNIR